MQAHEEVLEFWFGEEARSGPEMLTKIRRWYQGGPELDREIRARFGKQVELAVMGALEDWESTPRGTVALILLLDQFTRSVFRDSPLTYAGDPRAQRLSVQLIDDLARYDALRWYEQQFVVMPLTHAESVPLQERSAAAFKALHARVPPEVAGPLSMGLEQTQKYLAMIKKYGRFPHRNAILGRKSTPDEESFLREGGAAGLPPKQMQDEMKAQTARPPFIIASASVEEKPGHYPKSEERVGLTRRIGRAAGLLRLGINIVRLPPGERASWPHAEEKEEEFVYVLDGNVDAWVDGNVYAMKTGDFAAFPAGTGICHTFINNGDREVMLLVGGHASIMDNRIYYPLHPQRRSDMPWSHWWDDVPRRPQGSHDGLPNALRAKS